MLREVLPFKTAANNLHGHEIKHELLLDDLGGFRFSVKTDSLLEEGERILAFPRIGNTLIYKSGGDGWN